MIDLIFDGDEAPRAAFAAIDAVESALAYTKQTGDINVAIVDDEEIRRLNREFRGVDQVTDVLSFPSGELDVCGAAEGSLGDVAISFPRAQAQAEAYGHSIERELAFLAVHGALHLLGYDHQTHGDEEEMFLLQKRILDEAEWKR